MKQIFAMPAAVPAIPPNPRMAAMIAMTRNVSDQFNMVFWIYWVGVDGDSVRRVFDGIPNVLGSLIDFFPGFFSRSLLLAIREEKRAAADEEKSSE